MFIGKVTDVATAFMRFTTIPIAKDTTIISAKLQLRAYTSLSGATCNVKVLLEAADNPSAPTSNSDVNGRSLTTGTAWNSVEAMTGGTWYDSVDITNEVQEVVNRAGWASNNAVIVYIKDNGSSTNAYRMLSAYEGYTPKLIITV